MKQPEEIFNEWYASNGERYWNPDGHHAYIKRAFLAGFDFNQAALDKERYEKRLWEEGVLIYEGHQESCENWKTVADKAINALHNVDSRSKWQAQELYEWALSRDLELKKEIEA
jgi:hypothetical protein